MNTVDARCECCQKPFHWFGVTLLLCATCLKAGCSKEQSSCKQEKTTAMLENLNRKGVTP
jgi:hypothetical protein